MIDVPPPVLAILISLGVSIPWRNMESLSGTGFIFMSLGSFTTYHAMRIYEVSMRFY